MFRPTKLGCASALALVLTGGAAAADVTADEVWKAWSDYYTSVGHEVSIGSEERSGDTLLLRDIVITMSQPDLEFSVSIPELRMVEDSGTVTVIFAESIPVLSTSKVENGETVTMKMTIDQTDMTTTVSGTPEDMLFDIVAPAMSLTFDDFEMDGKKMDLTLGAGLRDSTGSYRLVTAEKKRITSDFRIAAFDYNLSMTDPESDVSLKMDGEITDLAATSSMVAPMTMDANNLAATLADGLAIKANLTYATSAVHLDFAEKGDGVQAQASGGNGTFDFTMSEAGLSYAVSGTGTEVEATSAQLPFPVNFSIAKSGVALQMPLTKSDMPVGFGLGVTLVDLAVSDPIWSMVDPTGQLPHDPVTLSFDVSGTAKMFVGITDPAIAELAGPPGEVQTLDLNALLIRLAGAELTGKGGFKFDNSDMSMGFPKPTGAVDLMLKGGNGLLDKLVAMGFVPEDQAMGARMMMGLFAVPVGEDELSSKIEFRDDGGLYANGQRLQ